MPRSLIDSLVYSHFPNYIMGLTHGIGTLLLVDGSSGHPPVDYSGKIFLHMRGWETAEEKEYGLEEIQTYVGVMKNLPENNWGDIDAEKEAPPNSMFGYCTAKIEPYNSMLFEADYEKHGIPLSWDELVKERQWNPMTKILGVHLSDFWVCKSPIVGIKRDSPPIANSFWYPEEPIEMESMKMCTETDRRIKASQDFKERYINMDDDD